jgi:hypothetical protein
MTHVHLLITCFFKSLFPRHPPSSKYLLLEPYLIVQNHTGHILICSATTLGLDAFLCSHYMQAAKHTHTHTHTHARARTHTHTHTHFSWPPARSWQGSVDNIDKQTRYEGRKLVNKRAASSRNTPSPLAQTIT